MTDKKSPKPGKKFAVIHGHFYQPPRENPWTGIIPRQISAAPFHDWNERIAHECYRPNAFARVLDKKGNLKAIIDNFEFINFNVGPTLMNWLKTQTPEIYERILEGDRKSMARNSGHGNAIAQIFNHVIMPLATAEERYRQILWGIEDFHAHFGRAPEAVWLSETAVNEGTIESLHQFDIRYIILSPFQAAKYRPLGSREWKGVENGAIDTTRPYRISGKKGHLDVIFYNHEISSGISFGPLLSDAGLLVEKFKLAAPDREQDTLVTACVDGESFGHHKKFGEMCLAFFVSQAAPEAGLEVINLARYLETHPPEHEVRLAAGEDGRGTSWSCSHGVSRWLNHCGCSTGGYPGWQQNWRTPLRDAFECLRDEIQKLLIRELSPMIKDTGAAFRQYYPLVWEKTSERRAQYLEALGCATAAPEDQMKIFQLMEAAYFSQLTFTSCAWFFADISGIEAQQNIKYAMRAIDLVTSYTGPALEEKILSILEKAHSNMPEKKNGKVIYGAIRDSARIGKEQIVANCAIETFMAGGFKDRKCQNYQIALLHYEINKESFLSLHKGIVNLQDYVTGGEEELVFYLFVPSIIKLRCYVLPRNMDPDMQSASFKEMEAFLKKTGRCACFSLKSLSPEGSEEIILRIMQMHLEKIDGMMEDIYLKNIDYLESFTGGCASLPGAVKALCEYVLTNRIIKLLHSGSMHSDPSTAQNVIKACRHGEQIGLEIQKERVGRALDMLIRKELKMAVDERCKERGQSTLKLLELMEKLKIDMDISPYQETVYLFSSAAGPEEKAFLSTDTFQQLAGKLSVSFPEEKK